MAGVEILAMEEVAVEFAFNWGAFFTAFGIIFGVFILFGIIISKITDDWKQLLVGFVLGTTLGSVLSIVVGFGLETPVKYEQQYKVIISDEVSMNEFVANYEIIDQEGKIYTVRERD